MKVEKYEITANVWKSGDQQYVQLHENDFGTLIDIRIEEFPRFVGEILAIQKGLRNAGLL